MGGEEESVRASRSVVGSKRDLPDWAQLLVEAVAKPGIISTAYSRFWNYSAGNQLLAMFQCCARDIPVGPIHTFKGWQEIGRSVKRGEKALTLCMPIQVKPKRSPTQTKANRPAHVTQKLAHQNANPPGSTEQDDPSITVFTYKPRWFVLAQTEGSDYVPTELPQWSEVQASATLAIERIPFDHPNGNVQGLARNRTVSVSPIALLPHKTLFHELGHVVLRHTVSSTLIDDHDCTPRNIREVEAECVALICCESLGLQGVEFCRGYIQHWLGKESIPDRSAQRIFKSADTILKAGYPPKESP